MPGDVAGASAPGGPGRVADSFLGAMSETEAGRVAVTLGVFQGPCAHLHTVCI